MCKYVDGIKKAKEIYRLIHTGGCKIISKGNCCGCFLCQCDKEIENHQYQTLLEKHIKDIAKR